MSSLVLVVVALSGGLTTAWSGWLFDTLTQEYTIWGIAQVLNIIILYAVHYINKRNTR